MRNALITPSQLLPLLQVMKQTRLASKFAPTTLTCTETSATKLALLSAPITPFLLPLLQVTRQTRPVLMSVSTLLISMETATRLATKNALITPFLLPLLPPQETRLLSLTALSTRFAEIERSAIKTHTGATGIPRAAAAAHARENTRRSRFPERESVTPLLMSPSMSPHSTATLLTTRDAIAPSSRTSLSLS